MGGGEANRGGAGEWPGEREGGGEQEVRVRAPAARNGGVRRVGMTLGELDAVGGERGVESVGEMEVSKSLSCGRKRGEERRGERKEGKMCDIDFTNHNL